MKKICFVIPRAYYLFNPEISGAEDKVGGAQKQAYILSKILAKDKNFDVNFLVADFGQADFEKKEGIKIWKSFNFSNNILKRIYNLFKTLKKINADTYIFYSADVGVAFTIFYLKFFFKKKLVYMIASDAEISKEQQKKHSGFFTAVTMPYVYKKADVITAQTKQQYKTFAKHRKRNPDTIIKNIYSKKNINSINHNEKNTILWVGRLTKIKNPELFLNLAKQFPNEQFVMIAPIVRDHIDYGTKIQEEAKQIKSLKLIDFISPTEINKYYKKAKIYVLTSDLEGFSNTMAEAMMHECAILSYNVNTDNILNKYKCGFCANKNIGTFYTDFEKLNNNFDLRKSFGKNGAKYIFENHKEELIIEKFKKLLKL